MIEEKKWGTIHPESSFKIFWEFTGLLLILYQGVVSPYRICFDDDAVGGLAIFENFIDFYFLIDFFTNFHTGYYESGYLVMDRKLVILKYLKFWLWVDLAGSFPFTLIISPDRYFDIYNENSIEYVKDSRVSIFVNLFSYLVLLNFYVC